MHQVALVFLALAHLVGVSVANRRGATVVVMQDYGSDDFSLLDDDLQDAIEDVVPHTADAFRSASPDKTPTLAALLTGRRPAELGVHRSYPLGVRGHQLDASDLELLAGVRAANVTLAHFGVWPFENTPSDIFDTSFMSTNFSAIRDAAETFAASLGENENYLINIWLPRIDATIDFGGTFTDDEWNDGISGVYDRSGDASGQCPDIFRGSSDDYEARYLSCPRQIYMANRQHEVTSMVDMMQNIQDSVEGHGANVMLLTSTNGPESDQVDAHTRARVSFRGQKRSVYDGGLRTLFRLELSGPDTSDAGWTEPAEDDFGAAPMTTVDILPTLASMILDDSVAASLLDAHDDTLAGINVTSCWVGESTCDNGDLSRSKPMLFEWRYLAPGHCIFESPRYAIVMGAYKLLHEPGLRTELFDLDLSTFEKVNLYNATLEDDDDQSRLETIKETMMSELTDWIAYLGELEKVSTSPDPAAQAHPGCAGRGAPQLAAGAPEAGDEPAVALSASERRDKLRGIIFILADDMGAGEMSGYNMDRTADLEAGLTDTVAFEPKTPELDRIMAQGTSFYHFYATMPVCSPSRATIMTGRLPSHKHVRFHNIVSKKENENTRAGVPNFLGEGIDYEEKLTTLTKFFSDQGFITGHFGKWHIGYDYSGNDDYDVDGALFDTDEYMLYGMLSSDEVDDVQFATASAPHDNYLDNKDLLFASYVQHALVNRTLEFLEDRVARNETFFVNLWLQNPHAPLNLAESYDQPAACGYPSEDNPMPNSDATYELKSTVDENVPLQIYRTLMHDQELQVARLVASLDDLGLTNQTLVVYMADNGPEDSTLSFTSVGTSDPFRGQKRSLYEGGIRVPLMLWWPSVIAAGRKVTYPATGADMFATLAGLAGYADEFNDLPDIDQLSYNSHDLSCLATGKSEAGGFECMANCSTLQCVEESLEERPLYFEFRDYTLGDCLSRSARIALRRGRYKAHWEPKNKNDMFPTSSTGTIRLELYDLLADPGELDDLLLTQAGNSSYADIAESLRLDMVDWISSGRYDTEYTPKASFNKIRYDESFTSFYASEQCTTPPADANAPTSLSVTAAKLETVTCSLTYLCDDESSDKTSSESPTYPFVSMAPTPAPQDTPTASPTSEATSPSSSGVSPQPTPEPSATDSATNGSDSPAPSDASGLRPLSSLLVVVMWLVALKQHAI
ncbi:Arylsulfatase [Hondaea fermentalgiana]|uniref:Arylsulfatase n=1 Tax=Hondaea fermentalgiana TaxID=2315210 RepID=A0A2R5GV23_9STRA|nr:Arylsulfatase [Hondaea fermentalgiana]|eukprot:GBG34697.1 Arylsulfatase [Hondaea fermentalgiana]